MRLQYVQRKGACLLEQCSLSRSKPQTKRTKGLPRSGASNRYSTCKAHTTHNDVLSAAFFCIYMTSLKLVSGVTGWFTDFSLSCSKALSVSLCSRIGYE